MVRIQIEIEEKTVRRLVLEHVQSMLGDIPVSEDDITIEVKSKQNYRSEWESAAFRARVDKHA